MKGVEEMDPGKCARSACRRSLIDFDGGAYEDLIGSGIPFVGALHTSTMRQSFEASWQ